MARSTFSFGMLASCALSIARRRRGFMFGSPPPIRAATVISLISRVKTLPFLASAAAFLCLMLAHLLCPAITRSLPKNVVGNRSSPNNILVPAESSQFYTSPQRSAVMPVPLPIAQSDATALALLPALANRHGLITGATGTGKTVTLQVLAENFSRIGVPVFLSDVKGDLSGLAVAGQPTPKLKQRLDTLGLPEPVWQDCPVAFWDVYGEQGHPVRTTVSELGPLLLGRMLDLNDTQQGVLTLTFKVADDHGLLLLDLKDLRAMLQYV